MVSVYVIAQLVRSSLFSAAFFLCGDAQIIAIIRNGPA